MRSEHLKEHRLTHVEGRCFPCKLCEAKFSAKSSLYGHIKKHHRNNAEKEEELKEQSLSEMIDVQASLNIWSKDVEVLDASSTLDSASFQVKAKSDFLDDAIAEGFHMADSGQLLKATDCSSPLEEKMNYGSARTWLTRADVLKLKAPSDSIVTDLVLDTSDIGEGLLLTEDLSSSLYYQDEIEGGECQVLLLNSTENIIGSLRDLE